MECEESIKDRLCHHSRSFWSVGNMSVQESIIRSGLAYLLKKLFKKSTKNWSVGNMSVQELDNFLFRHFSNFGNFLIQPICYSDFLQYEEFQFSGVSSPNRSTKLISCSLLNNLNTQSLQIVKEKLQKIIFKKKLTKNISGKHMTFYWQIQFHLQGRKIKRSIKKNCC